MNRLAERCGIMAITLWWTFTAIAFVSNLFRWLQSQNQEHLLLAVASLVAAIPMTCIFATCICVARHTDPDRRAS